MPLRRTLAANVVGVRLVYPGLLIGGLMGELPVSVAHTDIL